MRMYTCDIRSSLLSGELDGNLSLQVGLLLQVKFTTLEPGLAGGRQLLNMGSFACMAEQ